jgi:hypothetical protein
VLSVEQLKQWLNIESTSEHDQLLRRLEERAVAFLELRTDQHLGPRETFILTTSGHGSPTVWLKNRVDELVKIEFRDSFSRIWREQTLTDYEADGFAVRSLVGTFPTGEASLRVTYKSGYRNSVGPEPDVEQAVYELVETWFRQRVTAAGGLVPRRGAEDQLPELPRVVEDVIASRKMLGGL